MRAVYIFGSGGFAKEVEWMLRQIPPAGSGSFGETFFVTENGSKEKVNGVKVIKESDFFSTENKNDCICYIAIGEPKIREKVYQKIKYGTLNHVVFPTLIHKNVEFDERTVKIGEGSIICDGTKMTVNTQIGKFVIANLNTTIGHDCNIGDFTTISPGANISGNVVSAEGCYFGTNSTVLENLTISKESTIGACCTVTKNIVESGTYVGTPARKLK